MRDHPPRGTSWLRPARYSGARRRHRPHRADRSAPDYPPSPPSGLQRRIAQSGYMPQFARVLGSAKRGMPSWLAGSAPQAVGVSAAAAARQLPHRYRSRNVVVVGRREWLKSPGPTTRGCVSCDSSTSASSPLIQATWPRHPQPVQTSSLEAPNLSKKGSSEPKRAPFSRLARAATGYHATKARLNFLVALR